MNLRVAFRTGGGRSLGLGHVSRCLALAHALQKLGSTVVFLLEGDKEVTGRVMAAGCQAVQIRPEKDLHDTLRQCELLNLDAVVVDCYAWTTADFLALAQTNCKVIAIDDLAERELPVDLIVNPSAGAEKLRYQGVVSTQCLLGAPYILLRLEFADPAPRTFRDNVKRVLITVGGSDPHDITERIVRWVSETINPVDLDVVVGPFFEQKRLGPPEPRSTGCSVTLHKNREDMRSLMLNADLAICGGGQTSYELAAMGTPTIAVRLAENQTTNLKGLSETGALIWAGDVHETDLKSKLKYSLSSLAADLSVRKRLSRGGRTGVDGRGASRVAEAIIQLFRG